MQKKNVGEPFSVSLISGIENFYASEGYVTSFPRKIFVSQYRNISKSNPSMLCFRKILLMKKFMDKREGEISRFSFEFFLSHNVETFRRATLLCCVSENFWLRKSLWIRGRGKYQKFPSKNFCFTVPRKFVGEPFSVSLISGIEKF